MSDAKPEGTSKLLVRTVVGAVYALAIVGCLYLGVAATAIIVSVMGTLCAWELLRLVRGSGRQPNEMIALAVTALYPLLPLAPVRGGAILVTALLLIACAVWYIYVPRVSFTDVAMTVLVPVYCGFAFSAITSIRYSTPGFEGFLLTFGTMGSIWLNDAMAYFVGSKFGSHKLAPRISPNKSFEGFWGGLISCVLIWVLMSVLKVRNLKLIYAIPFGLLVGLAGVLGDLFESRIKRGFGVKDSGDLLPGHGGMLDRSDALLFGCMTAYVLMRLGGIL